MQVDSDDDGAVNLKDLATALSKWLALVASPGSRDLLHPFKTGADLALDYFIIMHQDPKRCSALPRAWYWPTLRPLLSHMSRISSPAAPLQDER